ncbi:MAG: tyrosine-type recombinase/integrase [Pseudomonadota bacterium]
MTREPEAMPRKLPPYVTMDLANGSKRRPRFFRRGLPKRWLTSDIGSDLFVAQYAAALQGRDLTELRADRPREASARAMFDAWTSSPEFREMSPLTREQRARVVRAIVDQAPAANPSDLTTAKVMELRNNRAATPDAANYLVKSLRAFYTWGNLNGWVDHNPAVGIPKLRPLRAGGHVAWGLDVIRQYQDRWPLGTDERLALEAFLWTAGRISDVRRFGDHMIGQDGKLRWTQWKNRQTRPVDVVIPMLRPLREAKDARDRQRGVVHLRPETWWLGPNGAPRSAKGFDMWWRQARREAGIPEGLTAHGIRKAAGAIMAEVGASEERIASVLGHSDSGMSKTYTRSADRERMAEEVAAMMETHAWYQ